MALDLTDPTNRLLAAQLLTAKARELPKGDPERLVLVQAVNQLLGPSQPKSGTPSPSNSETSSTPNG